ncbi:hypothetical protein AMJ80_11050, partial [bacterium SM23_31]
QIHSVKLGEEILARAFKKNKISMTNDVLDAACRSFKFESSDDLFTAVGSGKISWQGIIQKLNGVDVKEKEKKIEYLEHDTPYDRTPPKGIKVGGIDNLMVNFGKCCLPIPGDPIRGYITRGKGVTVHRITCRSIRQLRMEPEREISVEWEQESGKLFTAGLKVILINSENFIKEITPIFDGCTTKLINYHIGQAKRHNFCTLIIEIPNTEDLHRVIQKINRLKSVESISRLQYSEFRSLIRSTPAFLGEK